MTYAQTSSSSLAKLKIPRLKKQLFERSRSASIRQRLKVKLTSLAKRKNKTSIKIEHSGQPLPAKLSWQGEGPASPASPAANKPPSTTNAPPHKPAGR